MRTERQRPALAGWHLALVALFIMLGLAPASAFSMDHAYYNGLRSYGRHVYFTTSAGLLSGMTKHQGEDISWRGYGIENGVGTQLYRFLQLELSHTMSSMTAADSEAHHVSGSRVSAKLKMSFQSPMGNLELGVGGNVGSYGYIRDGKATDLASAGHSASLGVNYFVTNQMSIHGTLSQGDERWTKTRGAEFTDHAETELTSVAIGLSLWR